MSWPQESASENDDPGSWAWQGTDCSNSWWNSGHCHWDWHSTSANDVGANSDRTTIRLIFDHPSCRDVKLKTNNWKVFEWNERAEWIKVWVCNEIYRTFDEWRDTKDMWLNLLNGEGALVRKLHRMELLQDILLEPFEPIIQVCLARGTQRFEGVKRRRSSSAPGRRMIP